MRLEIRELQDTLGITSLYVTHDQVEAMTMADRMIVMNGGVAEQIGTPLEVYETPRTLFAAQFIGSPAMNVFDARLEGGKIYLGNAEVGHWTGPDGPVKLGLRPEHLYQAEDGPIETIIQMSEPLGANTLLHGTLDGSGDAVTASLPGVHPVGDRHAHMRFAIDQANIHLFDAASRHRLNA